MRRASLDDGMARFLGNCACTSQFECVDCPSSFGNISSSNLGNMLRSSDHVFEDVGCLPGHRMATWKKVDYPWQAKGRSCPLRKMKSPFVQGGGVMLVVDSVVKKLKPKCESQSCFFKSHHFSNRSLILRDFGVRFA